MNTISPDVQRAFDRDMALREADCNAMAVAHVVNQGAWQVILNWRLIRHWAWRAQERLNRHFELSRPPTPPEGTE